LEDYRPKSGKKTEQVKREGEKKGKELRPFSLDSAGKDTKKVARKKNSFLRRKDVTVRLIVSQEAALVTKNIGKWEGDEE